MKRLAIFGLQRSGTHWLQSLIKENVDESIHILTNILWKHSEYGGHEFSEYKCISEKELSIADVIVVIVKNPYSWFRSIQNNPQHILNPKYKQFIRKNIDINNMIPYWCRWHRSWSHWANITTKSEAFYLPRAYPRAHNNIMMRYEDLLTSPGKQLSRLNLILESKFTNPSKVEQSEVFTADRKDFYLNPPQNYGFSNKEISLINGYLDYNLVSSLGYKILNNGARTAPAESYSTRSLKLDEMSQKQEYKS